jgi:hypothetical protein
VTGALCLACAAVSGQHGGMVLHIPLESWFHDGSGAAVIETEVGVQVWAQWRMAKAAAKELDDLSAQIKAIIGDGSSLTLLDGRGLALITESTRRDLDKTALAETLGIDMIELERIWKASRVERTVYSLRVVDKL